MPRTLSLSARKETKGKDAPETSALSSPQICGIRGKSRHKLSKICEDCPRVIPKDRLDVLPEAIRCIECQRAMEAQTLYKTLTAKDEHEAWARIEASERGEKTGNLDHLESYPTR